jgi:hypothetical protein
VSDYAITTTPLEAVGKIVSTEDHAFLYTGPATAFVIPRRYLYKNEYRSFLEAVCREPEPGEPTATAGC